MAISWIGMYLKFLLVPNAIQSYSMFVNPENEQQLVTNSYHNHICTNCSYGHRLQTAVHWVFDTKKHPDVCLFV